MTSNKPSATDRAGYPRNYELNFIYSCGANGGSGSGCYCSLTYTEDNYSYQQARQIDDQFEKTKNIPDRVAAAYKSCQKTNHP